MKNGHQFLMGLWMFFVILFMSCDQASFTDLTQPKPNADVQRADIGIEELLKSTNLDVIITSRVGGYTATASGKGIIPSGEYAGWKFKVDIEGHYSGVGLNTLESGSALVRIRGERFVSTMDSDLVSFCCGEGHLMIVDGDWIFTMYGQVIHTTADEVHNHLFAGLGSTAGTMNMNIVDQTGSVVDPIIPHDPGIGLILDIEAVTEVNED
ncbi:MAG TPA: hypothetical protein VFV79_00055 [Saprospiraceae bacterium]|nr:hypothetical protein [Saprospiraceae bacterium]